MTSSVTVWLALVAGLVSFVSPCTLPLFPSYLGYLSGVSYRELSPATGSPGRRLRVSAFVHALFFCLGVSVLFVLLGLASTVIGHVLIEYKVWVRIIGGSLIIVMGLFMAGVIRSTWLMRERRFHFPALRRLGYLGSVVVGIIFAAGWTPCMGPILSAVLTLAAINPGVGAWYMVWYAAGFALPFLIFALTLTSVRPLLRYTAIVSRIGGGLLVIMGVLLVTGQLTVITIWIEQITGFTGFNV